MYNTTYIYYIFFFWGGDFVNAVFCFDHIDAGESSDLS